MVKKYSCSVSFLMQDTQKNGPTIYKSKIRNPFIRRVTYYAEFMPTRFRGRAVVLIEVPFALGGAFAALLGLLLIEPYGWRTWLVACAIPSVIFLIFSYVSCFFILLNV